MKKDERAVAERIASEVRRARKERGWSQLELAERAELSMNYVSLIERAERLPSVEVMIQLAAVLGTTLASLVAETAEADPWLTEATAILRALPPGSRAVVLGMLRGASDAAPSPRSGPSSARSKRRRA